MGRTTFSRLSDSLMYYFFTLCGMFAIAAVLGTAGYLLWAGTPAIREIGLTRFLFGTSWNPTGPAPSFGILPMILSSLTGTALSLSIALPLGILTSVFMLQAPPPVCQVIRPLVELMSGLPSVIYGMLGSVLLVPLVGKLETLLFHNSLSHTFTGGANLLTASIVLAVMILPTVIHVTELSLRSLPPDLQESSLALGATETETVFHTLLPAARRGILSGAVLGTGRAMGEAMAVMMVSGNAVNLPLPFHSVRLLAAGIATEMSYSGGLHRKALFSVGLVLFVLLLLVNLLPERLLNPKGGGKNGSRNSS